MKLVLDAAIDAAIDAAPLAAIDGGPDPRCLERYLILAEAPIGDAEPRFAGVEQALVARCPSEGLPDDLLDGRHCEELAYARNAIFAAFGRSSKTQKYVDAFESTPWYTADPKFTDAKLTPVARANVKALAAMEAACQHPTEVVTEADRKAILDHFARHQDAQRVDPETAGGATLVGVAIREPITILRYDHDYTDECARECRYVVAAPLVNEVTGKAKLGTLYRVSIDETGSVSTALDDNPE